MATILFYEKPGCLNNTRQKVLLAAAGHTVQAKNLLTEQWTPERLRPFFGELAVPLWFNASAPRLKSGEINPQQLDESQALALMQQDPLLIRRPLMEWEGQYQVGFDTAAVDEWIGLASKADMGDLETCPKRHASQPCAPPAMP